MEETNPREEPSPYPIIQLLLGLWKAGVVKAAIELDVFTQIAAGHRSAEEIARACGASERGIRILLEALCGLELLAKADGTYALSPVAARYLSKESSLCVSDLSLGFAAPWEWTAFGRLADAVKSGQPNVYSYMEGRETECLEAMVSAIATLGIPTAEAICDVLGIGQGGEGSGLRVLDIACGSGVYGYTIARRDPRAQVVGLDRRNILRIAARVAQQLGVADRVQHRPGNILSLRFGEGEFDLAILSNVFHQYGPQHVREVLAKAHAALSPGGRLILNDFIADDARCRATDALLMSVDMLIYTPEGEAHSLSEYRGWLEEAGFREVSCHPLPGLTQLLAARK